MTLTFNSHDFETIGICGNPEIVPFNSVADYAQDVTERGAMLLSRRWGTTQVAFDIGITGTAAERRMKLSTLASWLNVSEPKNLVLPDTPTWFYKAVPDGQITTERGIGGEIAHVELTLTDPVAYGELKTASFSSDSAASFVVGGNYPTMPTVRVYAQYDSSTSLFGLYYSGGSGINMNLRMYYEANPLLIYFNCDVRSVSYGKTVPDYYPRTITLDSDWFKFEPSSTTKNVSIRRGTGNSGVISWYERWL